MNHLPHGLPGAGSVMSPPARCCWHVVLERLDLIIADAATPQPTLFLLSDALTEGATALFASGQPEIARAMLDRAVAAAAIAGPMASR